MALWKFMTAASSALQDPQLREICGLIPKYCQMQSRLSLYAAVEEMPETCPRSSLFLTLAWTYFSSIEGSLH